MKNYQLIFNKNSWLRSAGKRSRFLLLAKRATGPSVKTDRSLTGPRWRLLIDEESLTGTFAGGGASVFGGVTFCTCLRRCGGYLRCKDDTPEEALMNHPASKHQRATLSHVSMAALLSSSMPALSVPVTTVDEFF